MLTEEDKGEVEILVRRPDYYALQWAISKIRDLDAKVDALEKENARLMAMVKG